MSRALASPVIKGSCTFQFKGSYQDTFKFVGSEAAFAGNLTAEFLALLNSTQTFHVVLNSYSSSLNDTGSNANATSVFFSYSLYVEQSLASLVSENIVDVTLSALLASSATSGSVGNFENSFNTTCELTSPSPSPSPTPSHSPSQPQFVALPLNATVAFNKTAPVIQLAGSSGALCSAEPWN